MNAIHDYIAVFDSGVGGISVLRHLLKRMPGERFLYFGDSANAPYGSRTTEAVRQLTLAAAKKLTTEYEIKALVIACNTATAAAVKDVRAAYPELIVIGIEPALKVAADHFPGGRVGVMATEVTLREEKFDTLLHRFDENCTIAKIPAPGLVQLIEQGKVDAEETETLLRGILEPYIGALDALVLGCTHYPFAAGAISRVLGEGTVLLDGGDGTARETRRRLEAAGLLEEGVGEVVITNSANDPRMIQLSWERLHQL
ncbi:MAG: glutamate racemase [Oscillospiraceae bacterium]|nr:glutamate racemase [Oscillospiraceae bacterium]